MGAGGAATTRAGGGAAHPPTTTRAEMAKEGKNFIDSASESKTNGCWGALRKYWLPKERTIMGFPESAAWGADAVPDQIPRRHRIRARAEARTGRWNSAR